jgi:hypothetical protein
MAQTLDDYAARYKDGRNFSELKQFELGNGGILACGKGVEPDTTIAVIAAPNSVSMMAVETPSGAEARIVVGGVVQPNDASTMGAGIKMLRACQKLEP